MYKSFTASSGNDKIDPIIRPSSANAKLQSSSVRNILESLRPSTAAVHRSSSKVPVQSSPNEPVSAPLPPAIKEAFVKQDRRLTLSEVDGIASKAKLLTRLNTPVSRTGKIKIEERITLEQLHKIKTAFEEADTDGSGTLDIDEFKTVVKNSLGVKGRNEEQIMALFMKIDSSSDGEIDWDEFCTYMQLEYAEKEEAVLRGKRVTFVIPPLSVASPHHKSPVLRILYLVDSSFMCCSQEGLFSFWSSELQFKKNRYIGPANAGISVSLKPPMWVTDIGILPTHNKVLVSTGDRELHFYEVSTFEFYCRITGLDSIPLRLEASQIDNDDCIIAYGDDQGCITIITIHQLGEILRTWKKAPVLSGVPTIQVQDIAVGQHTSLVKWKVHDDWVTELKYYHELRSVVSSCNHFGTALVRGCTTASTALSEMHDGGLSRGSPKSQRKFHRHTVVTQRRQDADQSVFRVYKGVRTFAYCKERNVLATGGLDRILRLWNPYMPQKPTGYLRGHNSPLVYVDMSGENDRIFSVSADRVVKVWDLVEQTCLVTLTPKLHKIRGDILSCTYTDASKTLAIVTDHISLLKISQKNLSYESGLRHLKQVKVKVDVPVAHSEPVTCVGYNSSFNHVITCSEGSIGGNPAYTLSFPQQNKPLPMIPENFNLRIWVVKLWDFDTGHSMFEFNKAHGDNSITCMTFDLTGRRLVTGGLDGALRLWNYNNGHCLRTMEADSDMNQVLDCLYLEINRNRYVVGVGWDKQINVYADDAQDFRNIQKPENKWKDYDKIGHTEDIVAVAHGVPNLLATASYDGVLKIWNFVSRHQLCTLYMPAIRNKEVHWTSDTDDEDSGNESSNEEQAVNRIVFINGRSRDKTQASLIAGCTDGTLIFWNIYERKVFAHCAVTKKSSAVSALVLSQDDKKLYVGDAVGYLRIWNIEHCAISEAGHDEKPKLLRGWRAHVQRISSLCPIEKQGVILTASSDHTVRTWTMKGQFVGSFGQSQAWDLYDKSTWQHPMVPHEVLLDPLSLPEHEILNERQTVMEVVHAESLEPSDSEDDTILEEEENGVSDAKATLTVNPTEKRRGSKMSTGGSLTLGSVRRRSSVAWGGGDAWRRKLSRRLSRAMFISQGAFHKDEEMEMLNEVRQSMTKSAGKRLRHEKLLSQQRQMKLHLDASSHAFQSLKCFDLADAPDTAVKPDTKKYIDDALSLSRENSDIEEADEEVSSGHHSKVASLK